jgi:hypothetical protein
MRFTITLTLLLLCAPAAAQSGSSQDTIPRGRPLLAAGASLQNVGYSGSLALGWQASADTALELEGRASQELLPYDQRGQALLLRARHRLHQDLYLQAGLAWRHERTTFTQAVNVAPQAEPALRGAQLHDLALDLGVGHQWRWDRLTLNLTWVGYTQPVAPLSATTTYERPDGGLDRRQETVEGYWWGDLRLLQVTLGVYL